MLAAKAKDAASTQSDATSVERMRSAESLRRHSSMVVNRKTLNSNVIELGAPQYLCLWWSIVALHCVCAVYLTQLARVHWFLTHPLMMYWARVATGDYDSRLYSTGIAFCVVGVLHWWQLLSIIWVSIRAHELVLPDGSSSWSAAISSVSNGVLRGMRCESSRVVPVLPASGRLRVLANCSERMLRCWRFVFSRRGVFGVESELFPAMFIVRESIEIVSQTFQARRSSELLPRPWLNNLFVSVVVANCWSTPILHHVLRSQRSSVHRIACLLIDAMLNIGASMLIPFAVFWPYYEALDPSTLLFPVASMYDALWFTRLTTENQLLFSLSTLDIVSKLVPHVGIYTSLTSVVVLIHRRTSRRRSARLMSTFPAIAPATGSESKLSATPKGIEVVAVGQTVQALVVPALRRCQSAVYLFFFAWGLAVLGLHVRAGMRFNDTILGCRQATGAWFATNYPCSVYTHSCYRQGTSTPDEDSWTQLDKETLMFLSIVHCPALKMPHSFQSFPNLVGVQLHNVSLLEWSKDNAISAMKHPRLAVLLIARANMSRLPDGVLEPLPPRLINVQLTHTNLTALPTDLHKRWHALSTLFVEHSLLTEFPETLLSLRLSKLSLHGNRIERLPAHFAFASVSTRFLAFVLSANPLRALPDTLSDGTTFVAFSAERTQLATLPAWTRSRVQDTVYVYGTPFCAAQTTGDVRDDDSALVACVKRDDRTDGKAPLEIFEPSTPL